MSDVFREVDEDLRRERLKEVWNRYGILLIGAAVLVVVAVAVFVFLESRGEQQRADEGDRYYAALDLLRTGDAAGAATAFTTIANEGDGGYPTLSALNAATAMAVAGDTTRAVAAFDAIAADASVNGAFRDVARIRAGMLLTDTASLDEMRQRLEALSQADGPFRPTALELMALTAMRVGEYDTAIGWLATLAGDANASQSAQERASRLFSLILSREGLAGATGTPAPAAATGTPAVDLRTGADATPAFGIDALPGTPATDLRVAPATDTPLVPVTPNLGLTPNLTTPGAGGALAPGAAF
ncbi:MAG: tetratricopeptide repeat protein [Bauldia sp.]|nr:tetratricopeptide repeat protein [Bauldia sp.]